MTMEAGLRACRVMTDWAAWAPNTAPLGSKAGLGASAAAAADAPKPAFEPKGAVFGAQAAQSVITLQARKPASIVIRGPDGSVYFARQMAAGQAYRAPMVVKGLIVDVSDPLAFDVYANGALEGQLPSTQTPLAKLAG